MEKFNWLAAVVASHPNHTVVGRTRLQKTVKLLQRLGAPLDYDFTIHFYGPYSEGVTSDIVLLKKMGLVEEMDKPSYSGTIYYEIKVTDDSSIKELIGSDDFKKYREAINIMTNSDPVVLELAATYDTFIETGSEPNDARKRLKHKKGKKCDGGNLDKALELLKALGLEAK
jgi:hypothetical protein